MIVTKKKRNPKLTGGMAPTLKEIPKSQNNFALLQNDLANPSNSGKGKVQETLIFYATNSINPPLDSFGKGLKIPNTKIRSGPTT